MSTPPRNSRFNPYRQALQAISARTGTHLPSLVVSFAVLHELTALVPLAGFFFGARALGVGEGIVQAISSESTNEKGHSGNWAKARCREWVDEGEQCAEKVGRRYGVFGFEKRGTGKDRETFTQDTAGADGVEDTMSARLAGDAANAILAYGVTKVRADILSLILKVSHLLRTSLGPVTRPHRIISVLFSSVFATCSRSCSSGRHAFIRQEVTTPELIRIDVLATLLLRSITE
ncbi:hypothetical protein PHLCEN_2v8663 [Hermanssonia centrifuga]|uniref:Uncharacterized protein n=1 Tax=Hermanssonia centrifuga TaxID=98765 RepID=A0A2R6NT40_9APHY|nr:hypothetical protein PHLCEN_2v8663 [Hermanssonia centrifuga]